MVGIDVSQLAACHWLLLRLAGTAPDDLTSQCRRWLGQGRVLDLGRAVTNAVLSQRIRLSGADVDLLAELLAADGVDASVLSMVNVSDVDAVPMYGFSPTRARVHTDMGVAGDRGPGELMTSAQPEDDIDSAALSVLALRPAVRAMWRSWRFPGNGAPWPRRRRIYLLETELGDDLVRIAAEVQAVLRQAGEAEPQVEVYPMRADLPSYQRLARARGALMWTRAPDPGVRVARIFDAVDDRGPWMAADRATLAGDEAYRLLDYLVMGELVVVAAVWMDDVVDWTRRAVVPMNLRTDGHWVWSDASAYYLENHGSAPEAGLVAHVQARGYRHPLVDGAAACRGPGRDAAAGRADLDVPRMNRGASLLGDVNA